MYADLTIKNSSTIKRFSHFRRFKLALELLDVNSNDKILDFGTGDGFMLIQMLAQNPHPKLIVGYEPLESQYKQLQETIKEISTERVVIAGDLNNIDHLFFDKICCLEVLEHLTAENQFNVLCNIRNILNDNGFVIVSVPLEIGLSGLMKNIARLLLRQRHPNSSVVNILKSFFCLRIDRGNQPYISTHIGFDYRNLEKLFFSSGFTVIKKLYSPLSACGAFCNSQVFYILVKSK